MTPRRDRWVSPLTCGLLATSEQASRVAVLLFSCSDVWVFRSLGFAMTFMFENLQVYQKAVDLADRVSAMAEGFPRGYYFLVDQLNRAALSIATNLAEGNGRFTKADRRNFFIIARGSAQECVPLLEIARRRGFIQDAQHGELRQELEVIAKMISGLINGLDKRDT